MGTATKKKSRADALADAEAFRKQFPPSTYERWEFAGSIRRGKAEVSDVEHVVIPAFGDVGGAGLFSERVNLLWHRLDSLMRVMNGAGPLTKHLYSYTATGAPMYRWGDKQRGVDFRGLNHEIFTADARNWGCQLLIRTGSADFSRNFVDRFKRGGVFRQGLGYLRRVPTGAAPDAEPDETWDSVAVVDEQAYFELNGMQFVPPEKR